MRGFVEGGVRGLGYDHLRFFDVRLGEASHVACGFHSEHNALGAARCEVADCVCVTAQKVDDHAHHIGFEFEQRREDGRVESVLAQELHVGFTRHLGGVCAGVVGVAKYFARLPIHVFTFEGLQSRHDFLFRKSILRNLHFISI